MKRNDKDYFLMPQMDTYALGIESLRESCAKKVSLQPLYTGQDGSRIVRPLTFRENLSARVEDYNTLNNADGSIKTNEQRSYLFSRGLYSCTAIAYKAGTAKFKIIPKSENLIKIQPKFDGGFMQIDYDSIVAKEFDNKDTSFIDMGHVIDIGSLGWLAAVEEDKALLSEYDEILLSLLKNINDDLTVDHGFFVHSNIDYWFPSDTEKDKLKGLLVDSIEYCSAAVGYGDLNVSSSFLKVIPSQKISTGNNGEKQ